MRWAARVLAVALGIAGAGCAPPGSEEELTWAAVFARIEREWPEVRQMSGDELAALMGAPGDAAPVIVDVRARGEYDVSHLRGAVWAETPRQIRAVLRGVPVSRPVVLYCSVGVRSSQAAAGLIAEGHREVFNLRGSLFQWANEGRPLEREGAPVREVHPYDARWGRLLDPGLRARTGAGATGGG
jgi:rhodanese-related sulfurtransferase